MDDFAFDFVTRDDYVYLVVEMTFRGQRVCQVMRDQRTDRIDVEILNDWLVLDPPVRLLFPLSSFAAALEKARRELMALKL